MKLAILTDGIYPFVIGGMQKHSYYLSKFLAQRGATVTLFHCVAYGKDLPSQEDVRQAMNLPEDIEIESICMHFPKPDWMPGHYLKESYHYSSIIFEKLKPRLSEFDFIYSKGFAAWRLIDEKKKGLDCPPISVKFHGYEMYQPPASFKARFEHMMLRGPVKFSNVNADYVFSYGGKITPIVKSLGVDASRIIDIPTGIESNWSLEKPYATEGKRTFVFLGRYERRKGIEELNEVLQELLPESEFDIHFIGPIPPSKKIKSERVTYHGKVMEKEAIQKIMEGCDVLLTPSHSEGMPNVIMEGMARGLAVIATDVGAVPLQVDDQNGWRLEPANKAALKNAMLEAIKMSDDDLMKKRQASIDRIRGGFFWKDIAEQTFIAIEKLVGQPA